jgi:hypothetical protein
MSNIRTSEPPAAVLTPKAMRLPSDETATSENAGGAANASADAGGVLLEAILGTNETTKIEPMIMLKINLTFIALSNESRLLHVFREGNATCSREFNIA